MEGYCNRCGKCCEAITLWLSPDELQNHNHDSAQPDDESTDRGWARKHFHPISREEAFKRNPLHRAVAESGHESFQEDKVNFYECDAYDKSTHRCTAHDRRPRTCRLYPYGDNNSSDWVPYSATCDYAHDLPGPAKQMMVELALELEKVTTCAT